MRAPKSSLSPKATVRRLTAQSSTTSDMTDAVHIMLKFGAAAWNQWRREKPELVISLDGMNLDGMVLTGINFANVSLRHASLHATNLMNADLRHADLTGANLTEADLISANLENAILHGTILQEADLLGANLANAQYAEDDLFGALHVPGKESKSG